MTKRMESFNSTTETIEQIKDLNKNTPIFGIDLGTTNSCISVIVNGDYVETITLANGKKTMPSCVMWKNDKFVVGDEAYKNREKSNVVYSVKTHMQRMNKKVEFIETSSKKLSMTPAEVSAEILKGLVALAGTDYGEIKDVVVSVPAYFNQIGRNETRKACELAGLNLIDLINEPTAASLCFDLEDGEEDKDIIVYDLGGGTFDVTLARILAKSKKQASALASIYSINNPNVNDGRTITCLGVDGDSHLGGDDIDIRLYDIVCEKLQEQGIDTSKFSLEYKESLILRLEQYKKQDAQSRYLLDIQTTLTDGVPVATKVIVDVQDFIDATDYIFRKTRRIVDNLLTSVPNNAKTILLVGGSTKSKHLVNLLQQHYADFEISTSVSQDLAVSRGAAIKAKIAKFGSECVQIFDVLPITIGVDTEGIISPVISSGSPLPANASLTYTTIVDNQTQMRLDLYQGKSKLKEECAYLGSLLFEDIPKAEAGEPNLILQVTVTAKSQLRCMGYINEKKKELHLSLIGAQSANESLSLDDRLVKRWYSFAEKLNSEKKQEFLTLLESYPNYTSKKDIMLWIKNNTEKLEEV